MMKNAPIHFQFSDARSAQIALDTLEELGYHAHMTEEAGKPRIQIVVDHSDLISALEIAQAHGGTLVEPDPSETGRDPYNEAYELDAIPIPAHVVNEDWPESYWTADPAIDAQETEKADDAEPFDPSGDDYDHFSPGVRM